jgi:hypothetical protein
LAIKFSVVTADEIRNVDKAGARQRHVTAMMKKDLTSNFGLISLSPLPFI